MSLNGALQVGRSAIVASQAGLQVAGNNMANASTPGYSRQVMHLSPTPGESIGFGQTVGRGVQLTQITRQIDLAVQARLRDAVSDEQAAFISQRFLSSIESIQNELTDNDLSSLLSDFFNGFSELANNPEDNSIRTVVIQQGVNVADRVSQMRRDYTHVREEIDRDIGVTVRRVNGLLDEIAAVNTQIVETEFGVGPANSLRDRRDQLVNELAQFMDVHAIEQPSGAVDVFSGSLPIVLAGQSRGVELRQESVDGEVEVSVRVRDDQSKLDINSGRLGGLFKQRDGLVDGAIATLDNFASALIDEVNRMHTQGQGRVGFASVTGAVQAKNPSLNLNHPSVDLPSRIERGSFQVHVTHRESGQRVTYQIEVDGNEMSLDDLAAALDSAISASSASATATGENRLQMTAAAGYELSFSDDTSGALAALGINTFFTGRDALDIAVNDVVVANPSLLAAGAGHVNGSNQTAIAIADLQELGLDALGGASLRGYWQESVNSLAVRANAAATRVDAAMLVRENLSAQMQAVSGVSLDEEAINLLSFQRQFQAAARFIAVIDETLQELLSIA
ncbi:MAG: flagellar hook-associated protein FlgK [Phycisphaerales bacterium]